MPRLTVKAIENAQPQVKPYILWDSSVPGFGVQVHPTGRKTFLLHTRAGGAQRKKTLGIVGVVTLDRARNQAQQWLADLMLGLNPFAKAAQGLTLAELAPRYLEDYARLHKKPTSVAGDRANLAHHLLPALGHRPLVAITRGEVATLHTRLAAIPTTANRCLAILSHMYTMADRWGIVPEGMNPCKQVPRYKERKVERYLTGDEVTRLGAVLTEMEQTRRFHPSVVPIIRLLLYSGLRRREVTTLQWFMVDFERQALTLPDTKTGRRVVVLNAAAVEVLEAQPQVSEWVFPGQTADKPLTQLEYPWQHIRQQAGIPDVRLHDLRHTFASWWVQAGHPLYMLQAMLGHTQIGTTQRYAHLAPGPVQAVATQVGESLKAALG